MRVNRISIIIVAFVLFHGVAFGQVTTGTISGTVQDSTGAVVPGANVVVRNVDTGLTRTVVNDEAGRYRVAQLPLGNYEVEVAHAGFQTEVRRGIQLTVGREAVVNMALSVGAVTERVEVAAEAPLVDTTSASVAYLVDDKKIRDLPLNGRNYTQLALLQPGVSGVNLERRDNTSGNGGTMSVSGSRVKSHLFLIDGQNVNDSSGGTPGSAVGTNLGVDAIREFSVITNNYSAEYGLVIGGIFNVVTQSGTNVFHGSAFEYLRNAKLDAKNFFDPAKDPIPPFKRNQFGGSLGGPIRKDRTFFLGAYEGLRLRLSPTVVTPVPNARARLGFLPAPGGGERFVGVNPIIRARLEASPLPNSRDFGDGTGELIAAPLLPFRQDYMVGRLDHQISDNSSIFARYIHDYATAQGSQGVPIFRAQNETRLQYFMLNWTQILGANMVNDARAGVNRSFTFSGGINLTGIPDAELSWMAGAPSNPYWQSQGATWQISSPSMNFGGGGSGVGGSYGESPRTYATTLYEFSDNVSYMRGAHALKFGAAYRLYHFNPSHNTRPRAIFASLEDFLLGQANNLSVRRNFIAVSYRSSNVGWFIQDDVRLTRKLTVNLGLRHEFTTAYSEKWGRMANLRRLEDTAVTLGPAFEPSKTNFAPRVGLALDVFGDGRTSVRAGLGMFHEQPVPTITLIGVPSQIPFFPTYAVVRPSSPIVNIDALPPGGGLTPIMWEPNPSLPTKYQWSLNLQQQIAGGTTVSAAYIGTRDVHLVFRNPTNNFIPQILPDGKKFFPATGAQRPNPLFAPLNINFEWRGDSSYHALQLNLVRRFSRGLQYQAAYTWSRYIEISSGTWTFAKNASTGLRDPADPKADRGLSSNDVRNLFSSNVTYDLPFGANLTGVPGAVVKGWQINTVLRLNTGLPFNITNGFSRSRNGEPTGEADRPNLVPGASNNPTTGASIGCEGVPAGTKVGTPDRYFDPCAFELQDPGTYGNLGKGTVIGPGLVNVDLSLSKTFAISERSNLQFRAELFNLFNRPNFGEVSRTAFTGTTRRNGSAGRIVDTITTSRQIQFGLRLSF
ncbi:MAG: hypothetical protein A3H27_14330 [Acidobacteria bacterium RIFCSPLOWO2_02_FULL_59_13]|nr:MAG: hypothetical protein A3H27_14330 [Acidobacteria bacterium RIFCSPLOWO2_02_FULL_59_13]